MTCFVVFFFVCVLRVCFNMFFRVIHALQGARPTAAFEYRHEGRLPMIYTIIIYKGMQ